MFDSVECSREIKKNESSNFTVVEEGNDVIVIVDLQKSGFSGYLVVILPIQKPDPEFECEIRNPNQ